MSITKVNQYLYFSCPHCDATIEVNTNETNCKIFRHGMHKDTNLQINPHLNKEECDRLFNENLIYGCGKPFKINEDNTLVTDCDYI